MKHKFATVNALLILALVLGNVIFLAQPVHAQEGVFLPLLAGNGGTPAVEDLDEIDMSGLALQAVELRADPPATKTEAAFGSVNYRYEDKMTSASTPLSVRLLASKAPLVNEAINIEMQIHAYDNAPATQAEIQLPAGVELVSGKLKDQFDLTTGQTQKLKAVVVFRQPGEYQLSANALSVISQEDGMIYGDADYLPFTIGLQASAAGIDSMDASRLDVSEGAPQEADAAATDALAAEADEAALADEVLNVEGGLTADEPSLEAMLADDLLVVSQDPNVMKEDASRPAQEEETVGPEDGAAQAAATRSVSICWRLNNRDGSKPYLRDAYIQIWDQDGTVGGSDDDLLASGYTGYSNGCNTFNISDADGTGTADVYVQVYLLHSGRYRVATYGKSTYWGRTETKSNITGNVAFGTRYLGGSTGNGRAVSIYNDLYLARHTINIYRGGLGGDPGYVNVLWQTGGTDGTYYSLNDQWVHLKDADVASRDTIVHEASHDIMDNLYGGWPISDCPASHFINKVSGKGCAWSEGWTYVITSLVGGDPVYTWPSGATLNLETPHCTTANWDDGPTVEGRIGGLLIDLIDPLPFATVPAGPVSGFSNETTGCYDDTASGLFDIIWDTIYDQDDSVFVAQGGVTNSFSNAWESRQYPRYLPHLTGHHNTIDTFTHD